MQRLLYAYEAVVYNRYCDLEQALPLVLLGVAMLMLYQRMRRRRQVGKRATGTGSSAETAGKLGRGKETMIVAEQPEAVSRVSRQRKEQALGLPAHVRTNDIQTPLTIVNFPTT